MRNIPQISIEKDYPQFKDAIPEELPDTYAEHLKSVQDNEKIYQERGEKYQICPINFAEFKNYMTSIGQPPSYIGLGMAAYAGNHKK